MSDKAPDLFRPIKGQVMPEEPHAGKVCRGLSQDGFPAVEGGENCGCTSHCEWIVKIREAASAPR